MSPHKWMTVTSDQREKKITHAQVSLGLCTKFEVEEGKEQGIASSTIHEAECYLQGVNSREKCSKL